MVLRSDLHIKVARVKDDYAKSLTHHAVLHVLLPGTFPITLTGV